MAVSSSSPPATPSKSPQQDDSFPNNRSFTLFIPAFGLLVAFLLQRTWSHPALLYPFLTTLILSILSFILTYYLIPKLMPLHLRANLYGLDINKKNHPKGLGDKPVPESLGLVSATVYIIACCISCLILNHRNQTNLPYFLTDTTNNTDLNSVFPSEMALLTAALSSVTFMTLLGFADDVLDLKWRYKLILPFFASLPLLVNYHGSTSVKIPSLIFQLVQKLDYLNFLNRLGLITTFSVNLLHLGPFYYLYMSLLSIFTTNAINIYAGINGLETGQSLIISIFLLIHNGLNITLTPSLQKDNLLQLLTHHQFSLHLLLPFFMTTLALHLYNRYPSKCFVGDTFCYFAGMTFAMTAILGHFSETLLIFFIPQLINFVYSLPQLVGIVECPRHRLPVFDKEKDLLRERRGQMTLINLVLRVWGPMREDRLCRVLLGFQGVCCVGGLVARYVVLTKVLV